MCNREVAFTITPHFDPTFSCLVHAFVIPSITSYDPSLSLAKDWTHLHNLTLADPRYDQSDKIDILLGAQVYANIIEQGLRKGDSADAPIAMKARLGWIISGATSHQSYNHRAVLTANLQVNNVDLNATLSKF